MSYFLIWLYWFKSYGQKTETSIFRNVKKTQIKRVSNYDKEFINIDLLTSQTFEGNPLSIFLVFIDFYCHSFLLKPIPMGIVKGNDASRF